MVRGRCPRNRIRWAVNRGVRPIGNAVTSGHAQRQHPPHPGNPVTAGRRGRRPLRAGGKPRYQHRGKQARKRPKCPPTLGSPERGAVAAHCAMTEGLVQRGCGVPALPVDRRRERAWRWGGAWNRRRRSSNGGAPGTVRPTRRGAMFSNKSTSSVIQRKGRRGRRPLRWLRVGTFQRSREV